MEEVQTRLQKIGLDETTIKNTLKGKNALKSILQTLDLVGVKECDKKIGNLLYEMSQNLTEALENRRALLAQYIVEGKISNKLQLEGGLEYLRTHTHLEQIPQQDFDKAAGVGIVVTPEQIKTTVTEFLKTKEDLKTIRYTYNFSEYTKQVRTLLPFAEGKLLTQELNQQIEAILGPKTEEDLKAAKIQTKKPQQQQQQQQQQDEEEDDCKFDISKLVARDLATTVNSEQLLNWRKKNFPYEVLTRFPPEPNGYLHIGHAKSINFNFRLAQHYKGVTYLRFDDTNPEKECQEFIDNIKENLRFLGYTPFKTTHASDNFGKLYDYAVQLIQKGKAYCCFLSKEESSKLRNDLKPSPYRDTQPAENIEIFRKMKMGYYKENEVCLRAKIDPTHPNPTLRDPAIFRIRFTPHPHQGDKWCIYPLYDFTHCICDSIEGITHSCCTLEFEVRRDLYYWFLKELDLYRPFVWEFSRLNVSNTVLSKRKLHHLVFNNIVDGWDDPRILTLNGLRRRGYTADSINKFCDLISVTRKGNENFIGMHVLESCIRKDLDVKAPRTMAILEPIVAIIDNVADDFSEELEVPIIPRNPQKGNRKILLTKSIYLDKNDVRTEDHVDFWGVAPGKIIGLKQCGPFKVISVTANEVHLERLGKDVKPKGFLHWLSVKEATPCVVRLYDYLFEAYDPNELDDYIKGINPNSKIVCANALMHKDLLNSKPEDKLQFERLGYFNLDFDSKDGKFIWNRTVTLQEKDKIKAIAQVDGKQVQKKDVPQQKKDNLKKEAKKE
ncbi:unnamed protein product [Paramecium pentaurelia]|uniref:Glutamine--tRNA ligase n=1 Tax=Paramecium pentaurelia TaxID=43138 RepID=A0A8S1Y3D1_9CILI|nr:unnamed protein product [Paramecium pentaurelia]